MARGTLRIFLGSAPGVGKTYAMLRDGHRLRSNDRGTGVPAERVIEMFRPIWRLDDATQATGGLTMVISLPLAAGAPVDAPGVQAPLEPQSAIVRRHHVAPLHSPRPDAG